MEYLLGLLTAVVFFVVLAIVLFIGYKLGVKKQAPSLTPPVNEDEKQRIEQFNKHFKELFSYDVEKALQRRKVTDE